MKVPGWQLLFSTLSAYIAGVIVVYVWVRRLHRGHRPGDRPAAVAPALLGGASGGSCVLLAEMADQVNVLGL